MVFAFQIRGKENKTSFIFFSVSANLTSSPGYHAGSGRVLIPEVFKNPEDFGIILGRFQKDKELGIQRVSAPLGVPKADSTGGVQEHVEPSSGSAGEGTTTFFLLWQEGWKHLPRDSSDCEELSPAPPACFL